MDLLRADARAIEATLTRDLIAPIVRLNLGESAPLPRLRLVVEEPEDLAALADQIVRLAGAGMPIPQAFVRERFGIQEASPGEPVLGGAASAAASAQGRVHTFDATTHARQTPEPDELDRLADEAIAGWQPMADPLAEAVQALLDAAAESGLTAEEVSRRLADALPGLPVDALEEKLASAQFAARLAGLHGREPEPDHG